MSLIEQYIIAMANLYGAFEIEMLIKLYNSHHDEPIDKETIHAIPDLEARLEKHYIYFEDEMFISQAVYPDDLFTELMDEKMGRPTYMPSKEELLKYQDEAYFNQSEALDEWIRFIRRCGNEKALFFFDDVLLSSCMALKMGWDAEETLKDLECSQYRFDINKKQVLKHLKKLKRHLRRWEYNGHTFAELNAMKKQDSQKKIGRNDSCPCGSGKKYKHCCLNK